LTKEQHDEIQDVKGDEYELELSEEICDKIEIEKLEYSDNINKDPE
jgi:hypothetical protein